MFNIKILLYRLKSQNLRVWRARKISLFEIDQVGVTHSRWMRTSDRFFSCMFKIAKLQSIILNENAGWFQTYGHVDSICVGREFTTCIRCQIAMNESLSPKFEINGCTVCYAQKKRAASHKLRHFIHPSFYEFPGKYMLSFSINNEGVRSLVPCWAHNFVSSWHSLDFTYAKTKKK